MVVRGLSINMDSEMISEELKKTFPVIKASQMTKFRTRNKVPLFQIQLEDGPTALEIFKLTTLLHHIVNIKNYNRPPLPCCAMLQLSVVAPLQRHLLA